MISRIDFFKLIIFSDEIIQASLPEKILKYPELYKRKFKFSLSLSFSVCYLKI